MTIVQWMLLVLILCFVVVACSDLKSRQRVYRMNARIALIFWLCAAIGVLWPGILSRIAHYVGVGRGVDVALYVFGFAMAHMIFRLMSHVYLLEQHITTVTREVALLEKKIVERL